LRGGDKEVFMNRFGTTRCGDTEFRWGERTYVMGVINESPDSFSGDGVSGCAAALELAHCFIDEGADILDIGGESTRPGSAPISVEEEIERVAPVIKLLSSRVNIPISVDTYKPEVARRAVEAGAMMLNDQWGLKHDHGLAELAAEKGLPLILMSNQRDKSGWDPRIKSDVSRYDDVMAEITSSLQESLDKALGLGVPWDNLIIDPGIGFGKTWQQNLEILQRLEELNSLGRPILVGPSRKSFIGIVLDLPADERVEGTAASIAIGIAKGADIVRVHDVKQMVRVCRVSDAIVRSACDRVRMKRPRRAA
jgi:dihydropteroate synthase